MKTIELISAGGFPYDEKKPTQNTEILSKVMLENLSALIAGGFKVELEEVADVEKFKLESGLYVGSLFDWIFDALALNRGISEGGSRGLPALLAPSILSSLVGVGVKSGGLLKIAALVDTALDIYSRWQQATYDPDSAIRSVSKILEDAFVENEWLGFSHVSKLDKILDIFKTVFLTPADEVGGEDVSKIDEFAKQSAKLVGLLSQYEINIKPGGNGFTIVFAGVDARSET